MNKRYVFERKVLIFWTLFVGIGAVAGAIGMLADPTGKAMGMDSLLPYFQVLPFADKLFQNLVFSGIMLLLVNGVTNLTAAGFLIAKKKTGIILGTIFGITLMAWIIIQFCTLPFNAMSTIFFFVGLLQFISGFLCYTGYEKSNFKFDESDYENVGNDETKAVVFFSRDGYTKKLAYEIANEQGAKVFEIRPTEKIEGNLGFWWCGRFGMHKWGMPSENIDADFSKFDEVTICSPIWVFDVSAPVREFCKEQSGKIKNVNYVLTHFMNAKFENVSKTLDDILSATHTSFSSYRCHFGKLKKLN